jgi:hypothetical protein
LADGRGVQSAQPQALAEGDCAAHIGVQNFKVVLARSFLCAGMCLSHAACSITIVIMLASKMRDIWYYILSSILIGRKHISASGVN